MNFTKIETIPWNVFIGLLWTLDRFKIPVKQIQREDAVDYLNRRQNMTEAQKRFIELDKKKLEYKQFMEQYAEAVNNLVKEIGIGRHFQDSEGIVYQTSECDGKFVPFYKYEVKRTKREGERAGSLSLKKAEELGYGVK